VQDKERQQKEKIEENIGRKNYKRKEK